MRCQQLTRVHLVESLQQDVRQEADLACKKQRQKQLAGLAWQTRLHPGGKSPCRQNARELTCQ